MLAIVARSKKCLGNAGVNNSTPMLKLNKTDVENLTLFKRGKKLISTSTIRKIYAKAKIATIFSSFISPLWQLSSKGICITAFQIVPGFLLRVIFVQNVKEPIAKFNP